MPNSYFNILLFLTLFITSCSVKVPTSKKEDLILLASQLQKLSPSSTHNETLKLSKEIYDVTATLSRKFKLTYPPRLHNTLINLGLREKGLCYDWSDELYLHLRKKTFKHYDFHLVVAHKGRYFYEHNALVVTNKDKKEDLSEGILLDAWRNSGKLYSIKLKEDTYPWKHRVDRCLSDD